MSMSEVENSTPKISIIEWFNNLSKFRKEYDCIKKNALQHRYGGVTLRETSSLETEWSLQKNNFQLSDRCKELINWKEELTHCINEIGNELQCIESEKNSTENALRSVAKNFEVVNECLLLRNEGQRANMCKDDVEKELHKESNMLGIIRKFLSDNCTEALQEMVELNKFRDILNQDLSQKEETFDIELNTLNNTGDPHLTDIPYLPNTDLCISYASYESWLKNCEYLRKLAEEALANSRKFRRAMNDPRERAHNNISAQVEATNFEFRKRIFEFNCAIEELLWQKQNLENEMEYLLQEINKLEQSVRKEDAALKIAVFQNVNRIHRPGIELCEDKCTFNLQDQVNKFENVKCDLLDNLIDMKKLYNATNEQIQKLCTEISNKTHMLNIDIRCLDIRKNLLSQN